MFNGKVGHPRVPDDLAGPAPGASVGKRTLVESAPMGVPPASAGAPLPSPMQDRLQSSTGTDLSGVRVHTGAASAAAAAGLGARAFATGQDIHFAAGEYQPQSTKGVQLLAHEVAHTVQQHGGAAGMQAKLAVSQPGDAAEHEADRFADHVVHGGPAPSLSPAAPSIQRQVADTGAARARAQGDLRDPRQFATYEEFLAAFQELGVFTAKDQPGPAPRAGYQVLGDHAADDTSADATEHGVTRRNSAAGEAYIAHPTAAWVAQHLPAEMSMAVYELPADCADVAVLLRHVWLHARGRTERYTDNQSRTWVIGAGAGKTDEKRAGNLNHLIQQNVYSGTVQAMVGTTYESRSFAVLEPMLHPGDVLVWEHHNAAGHRVGGHTQTIQTIHRDDKGHITSIAALQGNQPIFQDQAAAIQADQKDNKEPVTPEATLRDLPGRRIERQGLSGSDLQDIKGVWTWNDDEATSLVAAGPPSGVTRPPVRKIDGEQRRRVSDWGPSLQAATAETIEAVFEAFLLEVRAGLEGASPKATEIRHDSAAVATLAGTRLAGLRLSADRKQELGSRLLAQARSVGSHLNAMEVAGKPAASADNHAAFTTIGDSLRDAAKITEGSGGPPPETAQ